MKILEGVREHNEEYPVELGSTREGRLVLIAYNEARYNSTAIDLLDLIEWLKSNGFIDDKIP